MTLRTTATLAVILALGPGCPERPPPRRAPEQSPRAAPGPTKPGSPKPEARVRARSKARAKPRAKPGPAVRPACRAHVDGQARVLLGKTATPIQVHQDGNTGLTDEVATWPYDGKRVLVATRPRWRKQNGADPDGTLWLVECKRPRRARKLLTRKHADFGNAAATRDGKTLYFTGARGIVALSLPGLKTRVVTRAPLMKGRSCPGGGTERARDVVLYLSDNGGRLTFWRGGPCGHESDWKACELWLTTPSNPTKGKLHRPHPVTGVAVDAGGTVWLADGGRCDEPGVQDPASASVVLRSKDRGKTWQRVKVTVKGARGAHTIMRTAARRIIADARRPGHLVVLSETCADSGTQGLGGDLYATADDGKTWRRVPRARRWPRNAPGQRLHDLATLVPRPRRSIDHLLVLDENRRCWSTANQGRTWRKKPCPKRISTFGSWTRAVKGCRYRATDDGLYRRCKGDKAPRRVYPRSTRPCAWLTTRQGR